MSSLLQKNKGSFQKRPLINIFIYSVKPLLSLKTLYNKLHSTLFSDLAIVVHSKSKLLPNFLESKTTWTPKERLLEVYEEVLGLISTTLLEDLL